MEITNSDHSFFDSIVGRAAIIAGLIYYTYSMVKHLNKDIPKKKWRNMLIIFWCLGAAFFISYFFFIRPNEVIIKWSALTIFCISILLVYSYRKKYKILEKEIVRLKPSSIDLPLMQEGKTLLTLNVWNSNKRKRIVILLPLKENNDDVVKDVKLILDGFRNALENFSDRMALVDIDFRFYSHNHTETNINDEKSIIKEELLNGTEYFICTTSPTSKILAKTFPAILEETNSKGILLCTVASSPDIETMPNQVYRLFIKADEECNFLVQEIQKMHPEFKTASLIYFDTPYAKENAKYFKNYWGNSCNEGIKLDNKEYNSVGKIINLNKELINNKDVIFISGTWFAVKHVFPHLSKFKNTTFIISAAFNTDDDIEGYHKKFRMITCYPNLGKTFTGSIVSFFTEITLLRLVDIITSKDYRIENFHQCWIKCDRPRKLYGSISFSEDTNFPLKLATFDNNNSSRMQHQN